MKNIIRKISIGSGYPSGSVHYQLGTKLKHFDDTYEVSSIIEHTNTIDNTIEYLIYVRNNYSEILWKVVKGMPVVVEFKIDFE